MKRFVYLLLILPLLLGCKDKKDKKTTTVYTPEISVSVPIIKNVTLTKQYPGYLESEQMVNLVGKVNGTLVSINYKSGQRVKKGQTLFVIEPNIYQNQYSQTEAQLATAKAQLEYAESNYTRMLEALKSDAVSQIQVIQAEANVKADRAAVKNAEAALNTASTNLGYCYVKAPFDGIVSDNVYDVGNYISGAASPVTLATIYMDSRMYAYFNVADNNWLLSMMDEPKNVQEKNLPDDVEISLGNDSEKTYTAKLNYMSPDVQLNTGTVVLRAVLDNPTGLLKSGLYVSVSLPYAEKNNAVLVNNASIGTDQLGKFLYVVNDSNIVNYRHIEVGQMFDDTLRLVTNGISPDEKYVTSALMKVRNGMKINPVLTK